MDKENALLSRHIIMAKMKEKRGLSPVGIEIVVTETPSSQARKFRKSFIDARRQNKIADKHTEQNTCPVQTIGTSGNESTLTEETSAKRVKKNINVLPSVARMLHVDHRDNNPNPVDVLSLGYMDRGDPNFKCEFCGASLWKEERAVKSDKSKNPFFSICCEKGKVQLPLLRQAPTTLINLLSGRDQRSRKFLDNIRAYNSIFSFTSIGGQVDKSINNGNAPYVFKLKGANYHQIGSLLPVTGGAPKFSQVYIYDTENEIDNRMNAMSSRSRNSQSNLEAGVIHDIMRMLDENNPLVKSFRMVKEHFQSGSTDNFKLRLIGGRESDGRTYNLPTAHEVAALIVGDIDDSFDKRDIIIETRSRKLKRISELHPSYLPLQYPLLFPYGEDGFRVGIEHSVASLTTSKKRDKLTLREFLAFRIHERESECNTILLGRRLFQQFLVDGYTMVESARLHYIRLNQPTLRSEKFKNLQAAVSRGENDPSSIGQRIFMPKSFTGGDRYMSQNYQDVMALCKWFGYPDLFITMTCNPKWPEITRFLNLRGLRPEDRPDIVCRVFKIKLDQLIHDIKDDEIFGKTRAVVYTVEFQKRGLPHGHILVFLQRESKIPTPNDVDHIISAEIPDKQLQPKLYELVSNHMIHGPCASGGIDKVCIKNGTCSKRFPKKYNIRTTVDDDGFPLYKRRDSGILVNKNGIELDNRYVVPHSPILLARYEAHINVEWCNQFRSIKYLFKYINKGNDRVTASIDQSSNSAGGTTQIDEIKNFYNCRYISPCEAVWRIFAFDIHYKTPSVQRLSFHLPGEQNVPFDDSVPIDEVYPRARTLTYAELPTKFVWKGEKNYWSLRIKKLPVGRLDYVPPGAGELHYLSIMLHHSRGPLCYEDIRTIGNVTYPTFKDACYSLGLLDDDKEYIDGIIEASFWASPQFLRKLFASLLFSDSVSRPEYVCKSTWRVLADDILYRQRRLLGIQDLRLSDDQLQCFALVEIEKLLQANGKSLKNYNGMPFPDDSMVTEGNNKLIQQELLYDRTQLEAEHMQLFSSLTVEQRGVYTEILNATANNVDGVFFVYGYGGTGKTFIWRTLSAALRSKGEIVVNVASSGVAALLLPGGRTAHSRFGIPLNIREKSMCPFTPDSDLAALLEKTKLIIWDEAPMMNRYCFEALDRSLRDSCTDPSKKCIPFGGKVVVFCGDFRQILPVVPQGSREDIVYASINSSALWNHCKVLRLTKNMRLTVGQSHSHVTAREIEDFSNWIIKIGDDLTGVEVDGETFVDIPEDLLIRDEEDHLAAIVESTYPSLLRNFYDLSFFEGRAILAPTNKIVEAVNDYIMSMIPGEERVYLSSDSICKTFVDSENQHSVYTTDFLNAIKCSGVPNHILKLKVGIPVMLLRNMDQSSGLCNGTRLVITRLGDRIVEAKVLSGRNIGSKVIIPRMLLTPSDVRLPFKFQRRQFPLMVCFAMTINKSQGQTLRRIVLA